MPNRSSSSLTSRRAASTSVPSEIYKLMQTLVEQGAAVLVISSELPELVAVCDRA
jgi:ribose transport system ATP-binding protein